MNDVVCEFAQLCSV